MKNDQINDENSNEEFVLPSNIISEKILISNDTNFKDKVKEFLTILANKYENFKLKRLESEFEWNKLQNKNENNEINVYIEPEQITIKSPTTILNAPWGTGKTYFIEQIAWYWNDPEIINIRQQQFKNFMVIDVWKFVSSSNIINDVSIRIYEALCKFVDVKDNEKQKDFFKKIGKIILYIFPTLVVTTGAIIENKFPNSGAIEISSAFANALSEFKSNKENSNNKDKKQEIIKLLEEINTVIKPSLIVFDNVERMGTHAWEIIKTIQQLSIFDKLIFLLPINKTQLLFNNDFMYEKKNESAIDKYITLGTYFDLKQDYLGILKKLNFSDNDAQLINRILNIQINGYNLSIRLIEWSFLNNKIKESFDENKYSGLKKLKKIWKTNYIDEEIKKDFQELSKDYSELELVYKSKKNMNISAINDIYNFISKYKDNIYLKLLETSLFDNLQEIREEFIDKTYIFLNNIDFDWLDEWNRFIKILKNFKNYLKETSDKILIDKSENEKKIKEIEEENIVIEQNLYKYNEEKNNIEKNLDNTSEDATTLGNLNIQLTSQKIIHEKNLKRIEELTNSNKELDILLSEINKLIKKEDGESLITFINEFKGLYNKFDEKDRTMKNNKDKKIMMGVLIQELKKLKNENEISDTISNIFEYEPIIDLIIKRLLSPSN